MTSKLNTPCVGICSTGIGDEVCRGCKRFAHEVIAWNSYSDDQRAAVWRRLEDLHALISRHWFDIVDQQLLLERMRSHQLRFNLALDPHCWIQDLLKAGARQITDLSLYGLRLQPRARGMTLLEIKEAMDQEFFILSCAHYERYFAGRTL